jgi:hypothetical protein
MNTKDFLHLVRLRRATAGQGVPLGEAKRRATDFVSKFILGSDVKSRFHQEADCQIPKTSNQSALP